MLANHKKYQSLTLQFIDHFWKNNLVVCCGFAYSKKSGIEELSKKRVKYITGYHLTEIMNIVVADRADIGLSTQL